MHNRSDGAAKLCLLNSQHAPAQGGLPQVILLASKAFQISAELLKALCQVLQAWGLKEEPPAVRVLGGSLICVRSAARGPGRMMSCSEALCAGMGTASLVTGSVTVTARV